MDSGVPVPEVCASAVGRVVTQVCADAREATKRKARNIISLNDPKVRFMRLLGSVCVQTVALWPLYLRRLASLRKYARLEVFV